ncbi:colicin E1 family microcin immunity protein [Pantoea sp.]|uniref:colicin E1 family microcin immunity protein n=1 Tax=Pantoea sp. TaxID=69393 RepID=UPI0028A1C029|nr:colicin E1 family microcin immunity protein [Pantoea sp.]
MTIKYYLINVLTGFICFIALAQGWYENPHDPQQQLWMLFAAVSCLAFPFAKFAVESVALRFTSEAFWLRGFFAEDIGKNGIIAIYWAFCFFFAVPLFFVSIYFLRKAK